MPIHKLSLTLPSETFFRFQHLARERHEGDLTKMLEEAVGLLETVSTKEKQGYHLSFYRPQHRITFDFTKPSALGGVGGQQEKYWSISLPVAVVSIVALIGGAVWLGKVLFQ